MCCWCFNVGCICNIFIKYGSFVSLYVVIFLFKLCMCFIFNGKICERFFYDINIVFIFIIKYDLLLILWVLFVNILNWLICVDVVICFVGYIIFVFY